MIANRGGKVIETAIAMFSGGTSLIYHLAVLEGYRGMGIGRVLLKELIKRLNEKEVCMVFNSGFRKDTKGFCRIMRFRSVNMFKRLYMRL